MEVVAPQSINAGPRVSPSAPLSLASCASVTSARLGGSITAMTTAIAATSCMPSGAAWQHRTGGVAVASGGTGVPVGLGVGLGIGVGVGVGQEQIRLSHGMSLNLGLHTVLVFIGSV